MKLLVGFVVAFSGGLDLCGFCVCLLEYSLDSIDSFDFGGIFDSCFDALNFELLTLLLCTVPYH